MSGSDTGSLLTGSRCMANSTIILKSYVFPGGKEVWVAAKDFLICLAEVHASHLQMYRDTLLA